MTIGIPKSLFYYQCGVLLEAFFDALGCDVVVSDATNGAVFQDGVRDSVSECCLPAKVFMGHVCALRERCDYILSPYAEKKNGGDAICTRFWGIGDVIRHTYPGARLLEYAVYEGNPKAQYESFLNIGKALGRSSRAVRCAYEAAAAAQEVYDKKLREAQGELLSSDGLKVLLAGRSYVMHDPYIGGVVADILAELGSVILFSDRFDRRNTICRSVDISPRLYWSATREAAGAIAAHKGDIDGVLMLTVFPCAPDALACEMTIRVVNDIPIALILLDGLQGEAGLQTRIESFVDILIERKSRGHEFAKRRTTGHFIPSHGKLSYST